MSQESLDIFEDDMDVSEVVVPQDIHVHVDSSGDQLDSPKGINDLCLCNYSPHNHTCMCAYNLNGTE